MKTLLTILVTAGICYVLFNQSSIERTDSEKPSPPTAVATPSPQAEVAKSPTDDYSDLYNRDGSLKRLPPGTKTEKFWGHIVQHMGAGKLLMQTNRGRVVVRVPGNDGLPDGTYIPKFDGAVIGTYRYATTEGTTRDVWEVLYLPPEAMPTASAAQPATPQPGAWMWEKRRGNPLNEPAKRAESALTDQQRMAEWARRVQGSP